MKANHTSLNYSKLYSLLFFIAIFLFFYVFFYVIHPLIPIDSDEWQFYSQNRLAIPIPGFWNPTRVLPEILSPMSGYIAGYVVYPLTNNYYDSLIIVNALIVSALVTVYAYSFSSLMRIRFKHTQGETAMLTALFLLFHYMVFRVNSTDNQHMFYCFDVCYYYFYLIPNLIGASLVMNLMCIDWLSCNNYTPLKRGLLLLTIYLVLCSNLFCSVLFVAYVFSNLAVKWIQNRNLSLKTFSFQNRWSILVLGFWVIINLIESTGGRADGLYETAGFSLLPDVFRTFIHCGINKLFAIAFLCILLADIIQTIRNKKICTTSSIQMLALGCVFCYFVLLCTQAGKKYMGSSASNFAIFFYVLLYMSIKISQFVAKHKRTMVIMPLLFLILFSYTNTTPSTFRDLAYPHFENGKYDLQTFRKINESNIQRIIDAANQHEDSVTLYVPRFDKRSKINFPYATWSYSYLINILHKHGIISREPKGKMVIDDSL